MKESNTSVTKLVDILRCAIGMAGWLFVASVFPTHAQTLTSINLGGYLGVNYNGVANTYNAGYSMYVALLGRPQYGYYSPSFEASLEIGTWMGPQCNPGTYCDIEGGPGVGGGSGGVVVRHGTRLPSSGALSEWQSCHYSRGSGHPR